VLAHSSWSILLTSDKQRLLPFDIFSPLVGQPPSQPKLTQKRYTFSERPPTTTVFSSNTAKLSSPILLPRTVSYDASSKPPRPSGTYRAMTEQQTGRRRRSSSLLYQEPPETIEHMSDQAALPNLNANWVNAKGQSSYIQLPRKPGRKSVRLLDLWPCPRLAGLLNQGSKSF
jgi:hypothetical protein